MVGFRVLCISLFTLCVYLGLGGVIFHYLESPRENEVKRESSVFLRKFLARHEGCIEISEMREFIEEVVTAYDQGIFMTNESTDVGSYWNILNSVYFSATVITTIGYGHMAPVTFGGRAFFIFYALLGIPLCLVFLKGVGDRIAAVNDKIARKVNLCPSNPRLEMISDTLILTVLGLIFMILIPAGIFVSLEEGWDYGVAIYYVVVTLSTVGFGDYVAGVDVTGTKMIIYRLGVAIWSFMGLAWFAGIITQIQAILTKEVDGSSVTVDTVVLERINHGYNSREEEKVKERF